jgi:hypothetical protein
MIVFVDKKNKRKDELCYQGMIEEQASIDISVLYNGAYCQGTPCREIMKFLIKYYFEKEKGTLDLMKALLRHCKAHNGVLVNDVVDLEQLDDKQLTLVYENAPYMNSILKTKSE